MSGHFGTILLYSNPLHEERKETKVGECIQKAFGSLMGKGISSKGWVVSHQGEEQGAIG